MYSTWDSLEDCLETLPSAEYDGQCGHCSSAVQFHLATDFAATLAARIGLAPGYLPCILCFTCIILMESKSILISDVVVHFKIQEISMTPPPLPEAVPHWDYTPCIRICGFSSPLPSAFSLHKLPSVFFTNRHVSCLYKCYKRKGISRQTACMLRDAVRMLTGSSRCPQNS